MRTAQDILQDILDPAGLDKKDVDFPNAPKGWSRAAAAEQADRLALALSDDHWEAIRVIQACFAEEETPPSRRISDALEATFANKGGRRFVFLLFPGGPLAQGCALAGVDAPAGSVDKSFGSVR